MAHVRQRTPQEVVKLLELILQDVELLISQQPATCEEWRNQLDMLDAWQAVVLSNVLDLLPDAVRTLVLRFQAVRETALFREPSQF